MAARKKRPMPVWAAVLILLVAAAGYFLNQGSPASSPGPNTAVQTQANGDALIYYLDVGQGDSQLIRLPDGKNILIDAGTRSSAKSLVNYLKDLGVKKIDTLIATHPHEDHIGGMPEVIQNFEIGKIYVPKVADNQIPTTKIYESFLNAVADKGLKLTAAKGGDVILDSGGARLEFFAPNGETYDGLNSYSIVAKLTYGQKSFLFTGDAEKDSEDEMVKLGDALKSDVLKCGHHGSSTSTSVTFLNAVAPDYAVISCGVDNDYGHPHKETMDRLERAGVTIYRTDQQDTILARCDGESITFQPRQPAVIEK